MVPEIAESCFYRGRNMNIAVYPAGSARASSTEMQINIHCYIWKKLTSRSKHLEPKDLD